jgi:hypothetical protein
MEVLVKFPIYNIKPFAPAQLKMSCKNTPVKGEAACYVRNVISGSPDRKTDLIRTLIGGACRVWQWAPSRAAPQ